MNILIWISFNHLLVLTDLLETAQVHTVDPFNHERRYEARYPQTAQYLPAFIQGYEHNIESALAMLDFLEQHFEVSPVISAAIRKLCAQP